MKKILGVFIFLSIVLCNSVFAREYTLDYFAKNMKQNYAVQAELEEWYHDIILNHLNVTINGSVMYLDIEEVDGLEGSYHLEVLLNNNILKFKLLDEETMNKDPNKEAIAFIDMLMAVQIENILFSSTGYTKEEINSLMSQLSEEEFREYGIIIEGKRTENSEDVGSIDFLTKFEIDLNKFESKFSENMESPKTEDKQEIENPQTGKVFPYYILIFGFLGILLLSILRKQNHFHKI